MIKGFFPSLDEAWGSGQWLRSLLTYLRLLRHSENLNGADKLMHVRSALEAGELFVKSLAYKREAITKHSAVVLDGILYLNPLATINPEKSVSDFKYMAPMSFAKLLQDHLSNPKLSPVFRRLASSDSEMVRYFVRRILLDHSDGSNGEFFVESIVSSSEVVLQTCSLRELKQDYIVQAHADERRAFLKGIVDGISKSKLLRGQLSKGDLEKRELVERLRTAARRDEA